MNWLLITKCECERSTPNYQVCWLKSSSDLSWEWISLGQINWILLRMENNQTWMRKLWHWHIFFYKFWDILWASFNTYLLKIKLEDLISDLRNIMWKHGKWNDWCFNALNIYWYWKKGYFFRLINYKLRNHLEMENYSLQINLSVVTFWISY